MYLYRVSAVGSSNDVVLPDLPEGEFIDWTGVYDPGSQAYVIRTEVPIAGLTELEPEAEVGFDYSSLLPVQNLRPGAPRPFEQQDARPTEVPAETVQAVPPADLPGGEAQ